MHAYVWVSLFMHAYVCVCVCTRARVFVCARACVCVCVNATAAQRVRAGLGEMSHSPCPEAAFTQPSCQGALVWISVAFKQNTNTPWGQTAKQKKYLHQWDTGMRPYLHSQNPLLHQAEMET